MECQPESKLSKLPPLSKKTTIFVFSGQKVGSTCRWGVKAEREDTGSFRLRGPISQQEWIEWNLYDKQGVELGCLTQNPNTSAQPSSSQA